jgi:hypothetical protein
MEEKLHVECYSGSRHAERPVSFDYLGQKRVVEAVVKAWRSPTALHFHVKTQEDETFELRYDERADEWSIFELAAGPPEYEERGEP